MRRIATLLIVSAMLLTYANLFDHGSSLQFRTDDRTRGNITCYNSTTYYITQNITIASGETWIFDNTTAIFNCSSDGNLSINVKNGGSLIIRNGSHLTLNRTGNFSNCGGFNYNIRASGASSLKITNSNISHGGFKAGGGSALYVRCSDAYIANNSFYDCTYGIWADCDRSMILNNTFERVEGCAIFLLERGHFVSNNTILGTGDVAIASWNSYGRYLADSRISNNIINGCSGGIQINGRRNYIDNNTIGNAVGKGIWLFNHQYLDDRSIIENNEVDGASIGIYASGGKISILNNTASNCSDVGIVTAPYSYSYPTEMYILGNRIQNVQNGVEIITFWNDRMEDNRISNCTGIGVYAASNPRFINNSINGCDSIGVKLECFNNGRIKLNEVRNCYTGLTIGGSGDHPLIILENRFLDNSINIVCSNLRSASFERNVIESSGTGIIIHPSCSDLSFTKNSFQGNDIHAVDHVSCRWDIGGYGNYWSDMPNYTDWDRDGIVDSPVKIDDDSIDHYPLIVPWGHPSIDLIDPANHEVQVGLYLNITLQAVDPDGDLPFFELAYPEELDLDFDNLTGEISLLAEMEDLGRHRFDVSVSDLNGTFDGGSFFIYIVCKNLPPSILNTGGIEILAGEEGHYFLHTQDPNGDHVSVSILHTDATFPIRVRYDNYLDLEPGYDDAGVYSIELNLDDNNGTHLNVSLGIRVIPINLDPQVVQPEDQEIFAEEEFSYQLDFIEPNNDPISFHLNYSGTGSASIDEAGMIIITPSLEDVGEQIIRILVSDGNGSEVTIQMILTVTLNNSAPVAPLSFELKIESGGLMEVEIPYFDPDGDEIYVEKIDFPYWAELDIEMKRLTMEPEMDSVGSHRFSINITDPYGYFTVTDLLVHVYEGEIPTTTIPVDINMMERETVELHLLPELSGNRTPYVDIEMIPEFCRYESGRLYIEPVDGDHGEHRIEYTVGAVDGVSVDRKLNISVGMNLSTLNVEMKGVPENLLLTAGDALELRLEISGYSGPLTIVWEISLKGYVVAMGSGPNLTRTFNESGTYTIVPYIENGPALADGVTITVQEQREEEGGLPIVLILLVFLFLSVLIAGLILLIVRRRKEEVDAPLEMPIPFRAAPAIASAEQLSKRNNEGGNVLKGDGLPSLPPVKADDGNK